MKKIPLLFLLVLALGAFIQSCSDSKTYAERLEDERRAISTFKKNHNIKTISQSKFEEDTITNVDANEYVEFTNGVCMQIMERGEGKAFKYRDDITLRMKEYNIMAEIDSKVNSDTLSNVDIDDLVDSFIYLADINNVTLFEWGYFPYVYTVNSLLSTYNTLDVPNGLNFVIPYLKDGARIKLIIPSKLGHDYALRSVHPYYYEIRKIALSK